MIAKKNIAWPILTMLIAIVIPFMAGCAPKIAPVENITTADLKDLPSQLI